MPSPDLKEMIQMPEPGKVLKVQHTALPRKALTTRQTAALKSRQKAKVTTPTSIPDEISGQISIITNTNLEFNLILIL